MVWLVPHVRQGLRAFFKQLQGEHEIGLFEFGDRPTRLVDYTADPSRLEAGVGRLFARPGSGADVLDAIVEVSRGLRPREGARSAMVVITAEGPEFSDRYHKTVLDELRASDATLHSFVLTSECTTCASNTQILSATTQQHNLPAAH